jgi:DNA-binding MarR family transcriptional regulator
VLRDFRDNVLSTTPAGREITRRYYAWSPLLVNVLEEDNALRNLVKEMVAGIVPLVVSK